MVSVRSKPPSVLGWLSKGGDKYHYALQNAMMGLYEHSFLGSASLIRPSAYLSRLCLLKLIRRQVAQRRVQPPAVVEDFDVLEDLRLRYVALRVSKASA